MYQRGIRFLCSSADRHPLTWLLASLMLSVPAVQQVTQIGLDTNLKRLLPVHSPAAEWSRALESVVGDGGYFSVLFEGPEREKLITAVDQTAARIAALPAVDSVESRYPLEFIEAYRYGLVPRATLEKLRDQLERWQAEVNPLVIDLDAEDEDTAIPRDDDEDLKTLITYYADLTEYHQDSDGRVMGMLVRTTEGISNLNRLQQLYVDIEKIAASVATEFELWHGINGSLRTRVDEFDTIVADLKRAATISLVAILLALAISFRSLRVIPVVLYPLAVGLVWAYGLVPMIVGDLNTITSFLLMVLFGLGVDYSIHLVKRFRAQLMDTTPLEALVQTYSSTGRSVLTSGATTTLALSLLAASDSRGFADFGVIGGSSMVMVLLAMFVVLPSALIVGHRVGLIRPRRPPASAPWLRAPTPMLAAAIGSLTLLGAGAALLWLSFDYDFSNLSAEVAESAAVRERHRKVYPGVSAPAAIYVVSDLETLSEATLLLEEAKQRTNGFPTIGTILSLRELAPDEIRYQERLHLIEEIREILGQRWVRRIEDPDRIRLINDLREFVPPAGPPGVEELPEALVRTLTARDGSGHYLLTVDTEGRPKDGLMAMAFTQDLYEIRFPAGVRGPTGEKPVIAEVLLLVAAESPWLIALTSFGIFSLIFADRRSIVDVLWILLPLGAGITMMLGSMIVLGLRLNFFNIVVLPTMIGIGVDYGVHYYRRWVELDGDTAKTQHELFEPLTSCTLTTMMGYAGLIFSHHPGLRSIGDLAVLGVACCWITAVLLLPGLLRLRTRATAS